MQRPKVRRKPRQLLTKKTKKEAQMRIRLLLPAKLPMSSNSRRAKEKMMPVWNLKNSRRRRRKPSAKKRRIA